MSLFVTEMLPRIEESAEWRGASSAVRCARWIGVSVMRIDSRVQGVDMKPIFDSADVYIQQ